MMMPSRCSRCPLRCMPPSATLQKILGASFCYLDLSSIQVVAKSSQPKCSWPQTSALTTSMSLMCNSAFRYLTKHSMQRCVSVSSMQTCFRQQSTRIFMLDTYYSRSFSIERALFATKNIVDMVRAFVRQNRDAENEVSTELDS